MLIGKMYQGGNLVAFQGVPPKNFKSGSDGFFASFRVEGVNATEPVATTIATDSGASVWTGLIPPKHFNTGSDGFFTNSRAEHGDGKYTVQVQLVLIGSKKGAAKDGSYQCQIQMVRIGSKAADDEAAVLKAQAEQLKAAKAETAKQLAENAEKARILREARKAEKEQRREAARHATAEANKAATITALQS